MRGHYYAAKSIERGDPVVISADDRTEPTKLYATPWDLEDGFKQPDGVALTAADGPGTGDGHDLVTVLLCHSGSERGEYLPDPGEEPLLSVVGRVG